MSEQDVPRGDELPVLQRAYDLCRDTVPAIHEFPKPFRFTLGERLEAGLLDLVLWLREARFREGRATALLRADRAVERVRVLVRLACDWRVVSRQRYGAVAETLTEIGRMVGGWRKAAAQP